MANDPSVSPSRKRTAGEAELSNNQALAAAKKRGTRTVHHGLHHRQVVDADSWFACQDHEVVRQQLDRALALALDTVGFEYCEPLALTSFRSMVEEYMAHFLATVRTSMLGAWRRQPEPHDFVRALASHQLTLTSLLPHLDEPVTDATTKRHPVLNSKREIMPRLETTVEESGSLESPEEMRLLNVILNGREPEARPSIIPRSFPSLPSRHTYKAQEVLPPRESDPQKVRERATAEARLAEEGLRRFRAQEAEIKAKKDREIHAKQQKQASWAAQADGMWKDLMDSLQQPETNGDFGTHSLDASSRQGTNGSREMLSVPVNADSRYWRKPAKAVAEKG